MVAKEKKRVRREAEAAAGCFGNTIFVGLVWTRRDEARRGEGLFHFHSSAFFANNLVQIESRKMK